MSDEIPESTPSPPVTSEVDLTDFSYMPLEVSRLRGSKAWLVCKRRPELAFYMINLWTAAWHQRPAGSLEDDDDVLADKAMCAPKQWPKLKKEIMRGWVKCSDGRLYHPVVIEKVRESWRSKMKYHYDKECGRLRQAWRRGGNKTEFVPPSFDEWDVHRTSSVQQPLSNGQTTHVQSTSYVQTSHVQRTSQECTAENGLKVREGKVSKGKVRDTLGGRACTPDVACTDGDGGAEGRAPNGHGPPVDQPALMAAFQSVMDAYPMPTRWVDLQLTERNCGRLIEEHGQTWQSLKAAARAYAEHCRSGGASTPDHAMSPDKFFAVTATAPWSHDWKPVATKGQLRQDANLDAARTWLAQSEGK